MKRVLLVLELDVQAVVVIEDALKGEGHGFFVDHLDPGEFADGCAGSESE